MDQLQSPQGQGDSEKIHNEFLYPQIKAIVDDGLGFIVKLDLAVHYRMITLYIFTTKTVNITLKNLVKELKAYKLCCGVLWNKLNGKFFHYVIPICATNKYNNNPFPNKGYWRIKGCLLQSDDDGGDVCDGCDQFSSSVEIANCTKTQHLSPPVQVQATLSKTHPARIKLTLQGQRLRCTELERELSVLHNELQRNNAELSNDLADIKTKAGSKGTLSMNLFWQQQQQKLFGNNATGVHYHPMKIKFCLSLSCQIAFML